ncbi:MAG: glycosyltransferase family 2 protein [Pygmaiobacter massiliensis]|nr:glycosyltransferase family 2 protein [Pygmaiobacter massiliensis]
MKTLVMIPCYNEEENIERVVSRLSERASGVDYLIINDCSTDRSREICEENGFSYISLPVNLGIGGGVQAGYLYAVEHGYDITVQMDGDGQHDPAYLADLIRPVAEGKLDMAIGSRFIKKDGFQSSALRRLGIQIISLLIRLLTGARVADTTSGFRACNRELTAFYARHYAQDFPEPEAIVSAVCGGWRVGEVPVVMEERMGGTSSIRSFKSAYYMIKVTLSLVVWRLTCGNMPRHKEGV